VREGVSKVTKFEAYKTRACAEVIIITIITIIIIIMFIQGG
jgi:hypothetical protein